MKHTKKILFFLFAFSILLVNSFLLIQKKPYQQYLVSAYTYHLKENVGGCANYPCGTCIGGTCYIITGQDLINGGYYAEPDLGGGGGGGGDGFVIPGGNTPTPQPTAPPAQVGTIQTRGVTIPSASTTCDAVKASANYANGSTHLIKASNGVTYVDTQVGSNYVTLTSMPAANSLYSYSATPPVGSNLVATVYCHTTDPVSGNPTYTKGATAALPTAGTLTFLVGFSPPFPWFQVSGGGNAYAKTWITSLIPDTATVKYFDITTASLSPGIPMAGAGGDFSANPLSYGMTNIAAPANPVNWNIGGQAYSKDWYAFFSQRLNNGQKLAYPPEGKIMGQKPDWTDGQTTAVYTTNAMQITTPWAIGDGQKYVFQVNGDLTINEPVTIAGNGFIMFIVNGNITVDPSIGVAWNATTPVVEGVYVANKSIKTGSGTLRFVGKGIFIAGSDGITPQRNLESVGHNDDTSADYFIYNPAFLITMPDILKDSPYIWQEAAP